MSLVKVWTDIGKKKPVALIAKIVERDGPIITIQYLTEGKDKIHAYEDETYDIEEDSIAEYFKTDEEEELGFMKVEGGFIHIQDEDQEYVPEEENEDSDDDDEEDEESDDDDDEEEIEYEEDDLDEDEESEEEDNYLDE
jgi:hypothetical protein